MSSHKKRNFLIDPWKIIEDQYGPERNEVSESIFSLANEYMGTRGNLEEGVSCESLEGCYLGGIYGKTKISYSWKRKAFPEYENSMIHTTNWLGIFVRIAGEEFHMDKSAFSDYRRVLDMQEGLLYRELIWETSSGERTALKWERFISHADPHVGAIRLKIKPINHSKTITVECSLDATKGNRDKGSNVRHNQPLSGRSERDDMALLMKVATTGQYYIHRVRIDTNGVKPDKQQGKTKDSTVSYAISFQPEVDVEYTFDKIISVWTSRDGGYKHGLIAKNDDPGTTSIDKSTESKITSFLEHQSKKHLSQLERQTYEGLKDGHAKALEERWAAHDVQIKGDDLSQQGIRYCTFQLLNTYVGRDPYLGIGAKGMTGEIYQGWTFWDTESYCLPFYLLTNPQATKNLLEFRYNSLDISRARAIELDYRGAVYPLTTIDGTEDCPVWEYWTTEIHINAIIPYVIFLATNTWGNEEYLHTHGLEVLIEQSRFWASRAKFIPYRNGYGINSVTGPDEWQQWVNNNFYTNYMAKWVLEYTLGTIEQMQQSAGEKLNAMVARTGFDLGEMAQWREIAEGLILNYDSELDIYVQDDSFLSMDPMLRKDLDPVKDVPVDKNWTAEKYLKIQTCKQPDVLMAMFLMRSKFTRDEKESNYRFYEPRTAHGSSLSPAIHSIIACDIGEYQQAYDYYLWISRLDLDNMNNNTEEGLHISSMASTWLNIVCGFGGLDYTGPCLSFRPILPKAWESYSFKLLYRASTIEILVDRRGVTYQVLKGDNVRATMYGQDIEITQTPQHAALS